MKYYCFKIYYAYWDSKNTDKGERDTAFPVLHKIFNSKKQAEKWLEISIEQSIKDKCSGCFYASDFEITTDYSKYSNPDYLV